MDSILAGQYKDDLDIGHKVFRSRQLQKVKLLPPSVIDKNCDPSDYQLEDKVKSNLIAGYFKENLVTQTFTGQEIRRPL